MKIKGRKKFWKMYNKSPVKIQSSFNERVEIFALDPYHPILNNHQLSGKYIGYRSINITGNWRAIFTEDKEKDLAIFYLLGTHPQLYS